MEISIKHLPAGTWAWVSKDADQVGMQLDGAFKRFCTLVNANPGNEDYPLSVLRNHSHAKTSTHYGFIWKFGHPTKPALISMLTDTAAQHISQSRGRCGTWPFEDWIDVQGSHGYGKYWYTSEFSTQRFNTDFTGVGKYWGFPFTDTRTQNTNIEAFFLIAQDTTPGHEWFCWTLKTQVQGGDDYTPVTCMIMVVWRTSLGWMCFNLIPYRISLYHMAIGHGYVEHNGLDFEWMRLNHGIDEKGTVPKSNNVIYVDGHQLRNGAQFQAVGPRTVAAQQTSHRLPRCMFLGCTKGVWGHEQPYATQFGKITMPTSTLMQLGITSRRFDFWLEVPHDATHRTDDGWGPVLGSNRWTELINAHVVWAPPEPVATTVLGVPDFKTHHPLGSAVQAQMHPYASRLLTGSSSSGSGDGGGDGGSGGSRRPSTGLLWPRRS